ncbi:DUF2807 domain-containing protein [Archangium violaceum]|uniref:head GIN domain-containing protein n=1 Tax=Archangium violaceum TaxID=83451 RepID=UPI00193AE053|nr:head GIN domain-containing protein [Archangium violaceum]QRK07592.1 DUF2807 domain-containing protein [Archangium violaceum]
MWKSLCVGVAALLFLPACGLIGEQGDGHKVTVSRDLTGFTRVENHSPLDVLVREADTGSVNVTLDENLHRYITTRVSGETLVIDNTYNLSFSGEGRVVVLLPRFLGAMNDGSGDLLVESVTQSNALTLELEGSGDVRYCGPASSLTASLSGSGDMTLCTPAEQVLESVTLESDGSGDLTYDGSAKSLESSNDGSGNMSLSGSAPRFVARVESSGNIEAQGLTSEQAELDVSGSGNLSATVSESVSVRISGSGNVDLWGGATIRDVSLDGSGNLRRH